ncbi:glutaredoxin family protein [Thalassotalea ponticola]|uniref:glutaredoxin family protein n=1 Tax=Thalassotalea ponticola TaxID=1523392 RepID=UPI0025B3F3D8|nr:glutaredoxin family protein [Thalassotalea ponticola]MDN3653099.1 glutaredoxin family protein [Thalassotalea ponticola]
MTKTKPYLLYGTEGCHLCDEAAALCDMLIKGQYQSVDIVDDQQLVSLYSTSIPVLEHRASHIALYWPFDFIQLQEFISGTN